MNRVGIGFDFHELEEGRPLVLGGVEIPFQKGLKGHSDADAVLHALADALLGAASLSDIGSHFPDTDPRWKGVSSLTLLAAVHGMIAARGYRVGNADIVVIAEAPKIKPYAEAMRANIANVLQIEVSDVGIKATTMEGRGPVGRSEGIAAQAVVLLYGTG